MMPVEIDARAFVESSAYELLCKFVAVSITEKKYYKACKLRQTRIVLDRFGAGQMSRGFMGNKKPRWLRQGLESHLTTHSFELQKMQDAK